MSVFEAFILGTIQGLTEFLPVSSSGHLVIFQKIFNIQEPPIFFDTLIHFATLLAVVFYLRKEIFLIIKNLKEREGQKIIAFLVIATLPAVVCGFLLKDKIDEIFNSLDLLIITFLITAIILALTKFFERGQKSMEKIGWLNSLFIGLFQTLAILPGISRSGSTISAGLFIGLKREDAFKFSFLLSIPVILGAMTLQIFDFKQVGPSGNFLPNVIGFITAAFFGFLSLKLLKRVTVEGKLYYFAIYCLFLVVIILFLGDSFRGW